MHSKMVVVALQSKDLFAEFYRRDLARRLLLHKRSSIQRLARYSFLIIFVLLVPVVPPAMRSEQLFRSSRS